MGCKWLAGILALAVAGCGNVPASGPLARDIVAETPVNEPPKPYVVVKMDAASANVAGQWRPPSLSTFFKASDARPELLLAIGDQITVNIFEAGADGLFSSSTAKATQITSQIGQDGNIFVPYVGTISASGRPVESLRTSIQAALEDKAIQPQVQVLVASSIANSVTVIGDVGTAGQIALPISGVRILDVIALAGGVRNQTYQTRIILRRGRQVASADLEDIFDNPDDNVPVRPDDTVLVTTVARTFTVFGATGARSEVPFESRRVTMAEGLARAGGLSDATADAKGIFLFRFEPDHLAKALNERALVAQDGSMVPVVYRLDLSDPNSFFIMKTFELRDEDILYVANHPSVQFAKFLAIIGPIVSTGQQFITGYERLDRLINPR